MSTPSQLDANYWTDRYNNNDSPWDVGNVSTPMKAYFDQLENKNISILIPGCGNAYEAEYLLQQGFTNITLVDYSEVLAENIKKNFENESEKITVMCADFFDLTGSYDLIAEQTFLSALDPSLREKYVSKLYDLLKPGGKVAGVLFNKEFEGGPPFGGTNAEYEKMYSEKFKIKILTDCYNSIEPRAGNEVFIILEK